MKIECKLRREGGTRAEIGGIEYHFEPLADGAHVAEVDNAEHVDRFLAIPEGYKLYHGDGAPKGKPTVAAKEAPVVVTEPKDVTGIPLAGSEQHPPQFDINGKVYTQRDVVEKAFADSGLTPDEWNDLGEDERAAKIDIALDAIADDAEAAEPTRDELVALYEAKFGRKPNGKASIEKIKADLEA